MVNTIEINDVNVHFGDYYALKDINLQISGGKFISILGPNGSGKSTLLKLLTGIIKPNSGVIKLFGKSIEEVNADIVGYVPQIKTLDKSFPAKAIELVLSGINHRWAINTSKEKREKAYYILEQLGASDYSDKQVRHLSGGQLQRIYLARCVIREPSLLLLDEPATGIDLVCETNLNEIIQNYSKDKTTTVLMVTHDWTSAYAHTEDILLLNKHIVFYGPKEEAFSNEHLKHTFSHFSDAHKVSFGIKKDD